METFLGLQGVHWVFLGACLAAIGGGMGSAMGITYAAQVAAGIMAEDPDKFGNLIVIVALPGTQGIYGFITAILSLILFGLLGGKAGAQVAAISGFKAFLACLPVAFVCFVSAIYQGLTSAAAGGVVAKKPEATGKAIVLPAMVETYAVLSLIVSIFLLLAAK